jgi:hypothetical protein
MTAGAALRARERRPRASNWRTFAERAGSEYRRPLVRRHFRLVIRVLKFNVKGRDLPRPPQSEGHAFWPNTMGMPSFAAQ